MPVCRRRRHGVMSETSFLWEARRDDPVCAERLGDVCEAETYLDGWQTER